MARVVTGVADEESGYRCGSSRGGVARLRGKRIATKPPEPKMASH